LLIQFTVRLVLNICPFFQLLNPNKDEKEEKMVILDEKIKDLLAKVRFLFALKHIRPKPV
jgi:hypothetical protein